MRLPLPAPVATAACGPAAAAALFAVVAACANLLLATPATAQATAPTPPPLRYPATPTVEQVDTYHGTRVADPYRWLEDDNSADTRAWVQAQNAVTEGFFAVVAQREPVRSLYARLYDHERVGVPFKAGGRYFWTRNDGLQQQAVLYTAASLGATPGVALDPNALSRDGTVALTGTVPSRDGRLLAYGVAQAGSDWQTWRVRDLATGQDLPDVVEWVKFSSATWTPDSKGFFYARYDAPQPGKALSGVNSFHKLYYHRLGSTQATDTLVAENPADKQLLIGASVSDDGRMAIISISKGSARRNGLLLLPLQGGAYTGATPRPLTLALDAQFLPLALNGNQLVLRTDKDAPNGRLVTVDVAALLAPAAGAAQSDIGQLAVPGTPAWRVLVAEAPDTMVGATAVAGRYLLRYLRDASTLVRVHAADGRLQRELALPGVGTASGFAGRWDDDETFFSYTSLITPADIYRLDVASGAATLFKRPQTAFDATQFETRRAFVTSKDGTRFPVFIAHRKGLVADGRNPTLLHGYGGFNVPTTPAYNVTAATWMRMGGVYVTAALRGGGEYGRAWHEAGTQLKKQNVFDDFIAAAEWLVAQKITRPDRLAIHGGSNGGLLVGAVLNQRPELFGAAVPAVGVMDMLRFHKFTIGWAWVNDYGSSDDAAQFRALRAYSPLHNIRAGTRYPPVLVTTADHDDRVVPAHSFKYAAALQAADTGPAPKLIRIETQAGHGAGKPTSKVIAERADMLAFLAHSFGMPMPPAAPR
ncbi:MAG: prolyl oligopeptidase family serine peptidase [Rubrivivax sp.]|nr:prolyl oligopeptidase family serine peptidase [Rubrivivax sp.]